MNHFVSSFSDQFTFLLLIFICPLGATVSPFSLAQLVATSLILLFAFSFSCIHRLFPSTKLITILPLLMALKTSPLVSKNHLDQFFAPGPIFHLRLSINPFHDHTQRCFHLQNPILHHQNRQLRVYYSKKAQSLILNSKFIPPNPPSRTKKAQYRPTQPPILNVLDHPLFPFSYYVLSTS